MLDNDNLLTAIVAAIQAEASLSTLKDKTFVGLSPKPLAKPFCRLSLVEGEADYTFGGEGLYPVVVQFSVFDNSLATANELAKAINELFHNKALVLSGQINLIGLKRAGRVLVEGQDTTGPVYHALTSIEFTVQA